MDTEAQRKEQSADDNRHKMSTDDRFASWMETVKKTADWEKVDCECARHWDKGDYIHMYTPDPYDWRYCQKADAYVAMLEARSMDRFKPETTMVGFRPASEKQIAEWMAWLSSEKAAAAHKRVSSMEETATEAWNNYKFDPVSVEHNFSGMWPGEQTKFKNGPMWTAYTIFGKEQYALLAAYKKATVVRSKEDYDRAEKAYNSLMKHIRDHGDLVMLDDKSKKHKMPQEIVAAPQKIGRRAARKIRNSSESSTGSVSRSEVRAHKVVTSQSYAGGDDNDE